MLDSLLRELLTEVNDYDLCITEFLRVANQLLPVKSFYRLCPELYHASSTASGTLVRVQLLGQHPTMAGGECCVCGLTGVSRYRFQLRLPIEACQRQRQWAVLLKDPALIYQAVKAMRIAVPNPLPVTVQVPSRLRFCQP